ncbi:MAG: hypothetical protein K2Q18_08240 [Bdellovibrionales bacterium]|nr:hypothetical protein [Bdellovibrionales bacterium]
MMYLKTFSLILYSLAFTQAGSEVLAPKHALTNELLVFAVILTLPIFAFLIVKLIQESIILIDFSSALTTNYESKQKNEDNVVNLVDRKKEKSAKSSDDQNKAA